MIHNERKLQTLEIFSLHGPLIATEYALIAGFYPTWAASSYLDRLALRFHYLRRRRTLGGKPVYTITRRGIRLMKHLRATLHERNLLRLRRKR
jgi:hypothetical protein